MVEERILALERTRKGNGTGIRAIYPGEVVITVIIIRACDVRSMRASAIFVSEACKRKKAFFSSSGWIPPEFHLMRTYGISRLSR